MKQLFKILIFLVAIFLYINVEAKTATTYICLNGNKYQVDYNDTYVNLSDINITAIQNGYISYPSGADKENYKITSIFLDNNCSNTDGQVTSCPSSKLLNEFKNGGEYSDNTDYATMEYNLSTGKFDVKIKNIFNDQVYIRRVPKNDERNTGGLSKSSFPDSEFLSLKNGYYSLTAGFNEEIRLEFYEKSSNACNETFIWEIVLYTPGEEGIAVKNPAITDPNSEAYKICETMKNDTTILNDTTIKQNVAYLCYPQSDGNGNINEYISLDEYNNLVTLITEQYNRLKEEFKNIPDNDNGIISSSVAGKCSNGSGETKCDKVGSKTKKYVLYSNSNFAITCTETAKSTGDTAKLTTAGGGFSYNVGYTVERTCKISFIGRIVKKKPQCHCKAIATNDHWDQSGDWQGTNQGGPSEDFDSCVNTCDGGAYSQSCINSCYKEVYGTDDKRTEKLEKMAFDINSKKTISFLNDTKDKNYSVEKIETIVWDGSEGDGFEYEGPKESGNPGSKYSYKGKCEFSYSNKCSDHGTTITIVVYPSGCSWDPWGEYYAAVNKIKGDYNTALGYLGQAISGNEVITYKIVDSALKTKNGKYYTFTVNSKDNPQVVKTADPSGTSSTYGSATIGDQGDSVQLHENTFWRIINAKLPQAYLEKITGKAIYTSNNKAFEVDNTNNKLVGTTYDLNDFYNGSNKYFTSIYSDNINVQKTSSGDIELVTSNPCYNIDVSVTNLGTGGRFSMSNSCYYGVYNNYIDTSTDPDPGDIKYIFRPIELTDVFPEREPRWNWTNSASLNLDGNDPYLGYNVNPIKTTEHIEEDGHTIINDAENELDYEIIIGNSNIVKIKNFNKEKKSYTNFELNCSNRNITLCKSNFLDFGGYVRNEGFARVKDMIGKNGWEW